MRELREGLVAQDARVVHDDVDLAEVVERGLDDRLATFGRCDRIVVSDRRAAGFGDLLHDLVGHAATGARAVCRTAEIVDDDLAAALCELEGIGLAEATAGAGDDCDAIVEANFAHYLDSCLGMTNPPPRR